MIGFIVGSCLPLQLPLGKEVSDCWLFEGRWGGGWCLVGRVTPRKSRVGCKLSLMLMNFCLLVV